jgi:hypothetical protein
LTIINSGSGQAEDGFTHHGNYERSYSMSISNKKYCFMTILVSISLWALQGAAHGDTITIYGRADAGLFPGQAAYLSFFDATDNHLLQTVPATILVWTASQQVYDYALSHGFTNWFIDSAGDIWSTDPVAGASLTGLAAGTYRITPLAGAYMYDSWGWDPNYAQKYWWELHIKANQVYQNGAVVPSAYYMLGSFVPYPSADSALAASLAMNLDIPLAEGGTLDFWIWDWNSIDNSGSLTFQITPVPEPSALLLVAVGLFFLAARARK